MFVSKLFIAHSKVRQFLYNKHPFDRDLRGTDFNNAFINININKQTQHAYLSPAHDLFFQKSRVPTERGVLPCTSNRQGGASADFENVRTLRGFFEDKVFLCEHSNPSLVYHN